jgi:glycosyltransferase involved in cell wall biosynthesis
MVPQKAPILLFDAFRRAVEKDCRLHLHYIGSGPLQPAVEQFIAAFGLHDRVTLHSWRSNAEVRELMRSASLFLQHSMTDPHTGDQEGLPLAILEAMAEGLPVISTIHAGIPEAVIDGETGFLVNEGDSPGMADRIVWMAAHAALRSRFGAAAHARARAMFTWARERSELLTVLGLKMPAA